MNLRFWIPAAAIGTALAQEPGPPPMQPQFQPQRQMQPAPGMQGQPGMRPPMQPGMQPQPGMPQPPPGGMQPQARMQPQPQADFPALKSYLNLSDSQIRRIQQAGEKARQDAVEKERTIRPQIHDKHLALEDLLDKDNADATQVGRAMLEIRGLEKQIRQAHEAVRTSELAVLTDEQRSKFRAIQDAANLPAATREAQRLGLVPGPPPGGPRPGMQQPPPRGPRPGGPGMNPPPGQPRPMQPPPGQPGPGLPQ